MSHEVNAYPSPEEQALVMEQLYRILAHQVKSYQASGRMRASSSIRTELAQELLGSVLCTLEQAGGIRAWKDLQAGLNAGRKRLREQWNAASKKLLLVESSLPGWAEECRMEVLQQLRHFLQSYDLLHLAHLKADTGCFPLVVPISDSFSGAAHALAVLDQLWFENQIMAAFPDEALQHFQNIFCQFDRGLCENQCTQLLVNAVGKQRLKASLDELTFLPRERDALWAKLSDKGSGTPAQQLMDSLEQINAHFAFPDAHAFSHARKAVLSYVPRLTTALEFGDLTAIFV